MCALNSDHQDTKQRTQISLLMRTDDHDDDDDDNDNDDGAT